jgi:hypothetical protein
MDILRGDNVHAASGERDYLWLDDFVYYDPSVKMKICAHLVAVGIVGILTAHQHRYQKRAAIGNLQPQRIALSRSRINRRFRIE